MQRRNFILNTGITATGVAASISVPGILLAKNSSFTKKDYTVQDIINILVKPVEGAPFSQTVDTLKSGMPDQKVTGIVTTMFATISVIKEAVDRDANFIIAHEPTFYNHTDDKEWAGPNQVVKAKDELLNKNKIAVWRFHDYWHTYRPDGIRTGVLKSLGWEKYYNPNEEIVLVPQTSFEKIIQHVKTSLNIAHVRTIGNAAHLCRRIAILPGAAGGQMQMALIERTNPDVFICGEVHEWETGEYIRDSRLNGSKTALMILGHSQSEEPGMKWLAEEMKAKFEGLNVFHIPSGDPFVWM
jgi:putative NIF3 family GTP cyclohydrolase 1 type 2